MINALPHPTGCPANPFFGPPNGGRTSVIPSGGRRRVNPQSHPTGCPGKTSFIPPKWGICGVLVFLRGFWVSAVPCVEILE